MSAMAEEGHMQGDGESIQGKVPSSPPGPSQTLALPPTFYADKLSNAAKARKPCPIHDLFAVGSKPGILSMVLGQPNPSTFPFEKLTIQVKPTTAAGAGDDNVRDVTTNLVLELQEELEVALQYGQTAGVTELVEWIQEMMSDVHGRRAEEGWRVIIGAGGQDLLYKAFHALLNPGDSILVEGPTYPAALSVLDGLGCHCRAVDVDDDGMSISHLTEVLEAWDEGETPFPRVLYTIPFGANPSGVTATYETRVEVLRLARKYDLIIIEDDPYYFLYYGNLPRPPSYFSLERELGGELGRVLRLDSFSKVLAPGFRLGWATGPRELLDAIERHNSISVAQASTFSQIITLKLLREWGLNGFLAHTRRIAEVYKKRRTVFNAYLERHLSGLAEWRVPDASMYFWFNCRLEYVHPRKGDLEWACWFYLVKLPIQMEGPRRL
ncbi:kynurenine/alpha-aminoadipate aminotransferase [Coprinopsis cinerea AmutBmut pab1-1]|nr:kynurenine/alpha-aminoadipate aminotransferase [Coprinopsis cinerea AmutBmut pab1-1]